MSANFRRKGASSTDYCWYQKTRVIAQNIGSALFGFVTKHACDRQTDRQNYDFPDRASIAARAVKTRSTGAENRSIDIGV